jgi:nicotinamide-nucleotide amidase
MTNGTKASIITIGDELLIGQIIDTNSAWIAQQLNAIGIDVQRRVAVGDTQEAIVQALKEEMLLSDLVLLTGGLGPTADDVTKPVLCDFFGGTLVVNEIVLAHVKDIFLRRNRPIIERNIKQAEVPDICTVIPNELGTAPGMLFEQQGKLIVSMPGVPFEMKGMMLATLLPLFQERFQQQHVIVHRNILTFGEGESFLAEKIKDIETQLPAHIKLAYLPSPYAVKLRLTARGKNEATLIAETEQYQIQLAERIANHVVSFDDQPLEAQIGAVLQSKQLTLGLAESCTGGYIGHRMTQIAGSSSYFKGSVVTYATSAKVNLLGIDAAFIQEHGVVSEAVAMAMSDAAVTTLGADIGLGITGIFSESDYEDRSPVGTLFIALSGKGFRVSKQYRLYHDRIQNKETATQIALYLIWEFINKTIE